MTKDIARQITDTDNQVSGILVLTPAESKRLIAKAVVAMPQVKRALEKGRVIIANGTTTAFVAEEILGRPVSKYRYAAGYIGEGKLAATPPELRTDPYVLVDGRPVDVPAKEMIQEFEADDVFIKSANAVDAEGHVGVLMANEKGGTIAMALGPVMARGCHLIVPVGLEKLVPSVTEASHKGGILRLKYAMGLKVGLMPVVNATVVTEIQALRILAGVEATHVASGGIGGCEGAVALVVEGTDEAVQKAFEVVGGVKGERPVLKETTWTLD
jgi:hypothetical protein